MTGGATPLARSVPSASVPATPRGEAFAAAAATLPSEIHEAQVRIAGRPAVLRVAGDGLAARLDAAFAALDPSDPGAPALAIELWDRDLTGVPCPPARLAPDRTWTGVDQRLRVFGGGRILRLETPGAVTLLDRRSERIEGERVRPEALSPHEAAQPVSELLSVWLHDRGVQRVHAAAVARGDRAALVAGEGGSGKSTTALACALAGWSYLGDDKVGLEPEGEGFRALALYASACADPSLLERHPALRPHAAPGPALKSVIAMARVPGVRLAAAATVRAVLVPRPAGSGPGSTVRGISPAAALRALAPTSLLQPFGAGPGGLEAMARLVGRAACFALDLGRDPAGIADAVAEALDRAEAGP